MPSYETRLTAQDFRVASRFGYVKGLGLDRVPVPPYLTPPLAGAYWCGVLRARCDLAAYAARSGAGALMGPDGPHREDL